MLDGKEDKKEFSGSGPHQDIRERHNGIEKKEREEPGKGEATGNEYRTEYEYNTGNGHGTESRDCPGSHHRSGI